ncbi:MAG: DUF4236 domain-containing protein [Nanoarchaeota archaeon]|nr:DUF4236 domain-containing protein [Nanoarchaeota archaeon]
MGFLIRRRQSFGPFALNLSTKGVGISTGVKGARLSVGPNGTFVHLGRKGFYYRKKIGGFSEPHQQKINHQVSKKQEVKSRIESADIKNFQNSSPDSLLKEINEKNSLVKYSTISLIVSIIIFFIFLGAGSPGWLNFILMILSVALYSFLFKKDTERKTVTVVYKLDKEIKEPFNKLNKEFIKFDKSEKIWRIETQQGTDDWKRNSGASNLVNRDEIQIMNELPKFFDSNIIPYGFKIDSQEYYFFPDRILIYQGKEVGMATYSELQIYTSITKFIEDQEVPSDTEVIGHNWKYMNKNGGPDRRFNNNYQIPVVLYSEIDLQTKSGINLKFQTSNKNACENLLQSFEGIRKIKAKK